MYNVSDKFKEYVKNNGYIEKRAKSAKEPVAKLKWSDFELEPLKPNLIKNGWDDFEAYGSGENFLTSKPDFSDWEAVSGANVEIKQNVKLDEIDVSVATHIKTKKGSSQGQLVGKFQVDAPAVVEMYVKNNSPERMFVRVGAPYKYSFINSQEAKLIEIDLDEYSATNIEFGGEKDLDIVAWNPIVYKKGDKPLAVIKTPLENGLTRIQTWGGNNRIKLRAYAVSNSNKGDKQNRSLYVNNMSDSKLFFNQDGGTFEGNPEAVWSHKEEAHKNYTGLFLEQRIRTAVYIRALEVSDNLDFIASDPVIVEDDEPNPAMIVDDLGNGKSKVRVFGASENTKLVHRGTKGIKGEPYTVKTNIDNKGNQLQLDTNLDEQSETIKKGNNDVKLEGKLKDNNIEIKLGRG